MGGRSFHPEIPANVKWVPGLSIHLSKLLCLMIWPSPVRVTSSHITGHPSGQLAFVSCNNVANGAFAEPEPTLSRSTHPIKAVWVLSHVDMIRPRSSRAHMSPAIFIFVQVWSVCPASLLAHCDFLPVWAPWAPRPCPFWHCAFWPDGDGTGSHPETLAGTARRSGRQQLGHPVVSLPLVRRKHPLSSIDISIIITNVYMRGPRSD